MITTCSSKTVTVIKSGVINIGCFADLRDDDTKFPDIYFLSLLQEEAIIDGIKGKEGELIINVMDSNSNITLENGELIIDLENDNESNYSINTNGELIYNG